MDEITSKQQRDFDIALYYSEYNFDMAKEMLAGEYKDMYALKGVFTSSTASGGLLVFFNLYSQSCSSAYLVISSAASFDGLNIEINWHDFEESLVRVYNSEQSDSLQSGHLLKGLLANMSFEFNKEIKKHLVASDIIMINYRFQKLIESELKIPQIKLSMAVEPLSSLEMELKSRTSEKLDIEKIKKNRSSEEARLYDLIEAARRADNPLEGEDVQLMLEGSLVLAPIKGKEVAGLEEGDEVKVVITEKSQRAVQMGRIFNVYDEKKGTFAPIKGRVVVTNSCNKKGLDVYVSIAKGIFVKAFEEENVKIEVAGAEPDKQNKKKKMVIDETVKDNRKNNNLIIIICCAIFVFVFLLLLLFC